MYMLPKCNVTPYIYIMYICTCILCIYIAACNVALRLQLARYACLTHQYCRPEKKDQGQLLSTVISPKMHYAEFCGTNAVPPISVKGYPNVKNKGGGEGLGEKSSFPDFYTYLFLHVLLEKRSKNVTYFHFLSSLC